jgi:hypothetical protein
MIGTGSNSHTEGWGNNSNLTLKEGRKSLNLKRKDRRRVSTLKV